MRKIFCFEKKDIDVKDIAKHLEKKLNLKFLMNPSKEINGVIYANHFPAGKKESPKYNEGCYWCNEELDEKEHTCVVVVLYEEVKSVAGVILPNTDGRTASEVTQKPHTQLKSVHEKIKSEIDKYASVNKLKVRHHEVDDKFNKHLDFFVPR